MTGAPEEDTILLMFSGGIDSTYLLGVALLAADLTSPGTACLPMVASEGWPRCRSQEEAD